MMTYMLKTRFRVMKDLGQIVGSDTSIRMKLTYILSISIMWSASFSSIEFGGLAFVQSVWPRKT